MIPEHAYILAGTGSRELARAPLHERQVLQYKLDEHIREAKEAHPDLHLMSGFAEGFDELLAWRSIAHEVPLIAAIPNAGYANYYWRDNSYSGKDRLETFNFLLAQAVHVEYVTKTLYVNGRHSNFVRNDWMVAHAQEFVVYSPYSRGTRDCLATIVRKGLPYTILDEGS